MMSSDQGLPLASRAGSRDEVVVSDLTPKHALFVEEYLKDFNATQAAIRVGYSERRAMQTGHDLVRKREISEAIETRKAELMEKSKMTLEKWVRLVTALALYDPRKMFDQFSNLREIPEMSRVQAMAVAGCAHFEAFEGNGKNRIQTGRSRRVKLLDRTPYVLMLGKFLNAFSEKKPESPTEPPRNRIAWESIPLAERIVLRDELVAIQQRYATLVDRARILTNSKTTSQ